MEEKSMEGKSMGEESMEEESIEEKSIEEKSIEEKSIEEEKLQAEKKTGRNRVEQWKTAGSLFLYFCKIGFFTFGGGWSILAQMEEEFIDKRKVITKQDLLDMTSVGKSLPGIMITNITIVFGYRMAGVPGAIASTIGITVPPVVILSFVTVVYRWIKDNLYVGYVLKGIRAAVAPIIMASTVSLWKSGIKDRPAFFIFLSAFLCSAFTNMGNIPIVVSGLLLAVVLNFSVKRRKQD